MLVGGATVDFPDGAKDRSFADRRVRAVLVISGQGAGQQGLTEHSWKKMALPMMTMTGSKDRGAGGQGPEWKKQPYDFSPAGDKYHVFIEGASHFSFGGELAGGGLTASALGPGVRQKLEGGRRVGFGPGGAAGEQAEVFSTVKTATINFWNAYLKQEPQARVYLASDQLAAQTKGRVRVSHR
jgi:predicted dienelactone hydrolase